jgi:hypothetical protein
MFEPVTGMKTYRLDVNAAMMVFKRRLGRTFLVTGLLGLSIGAVPSFLGSANIPAGRLILITVVTMLLAAPVLAWGWIVQCRREKVRCDSYELTLSADLVCRTIQDLPPMRVLRREVTRIHEHPEKGLTIATAHPNQFVFIPKPLIGYEEVREALQCWHSTDEPPSPARGVAISVLQIGFALAPIGAMLMRVNIWWAIAAGAPAIPLGAWQIRTVLQSSHLDHRQKRALVWAIVPWTVAPFAWLQFIAIWRYMAP